MTSDAAQVWREAEGASVNKHYGYVKQDGRLTSTGAIAAAAVIARAIAEAVEQERAKAEALAEALRAVEFARMTDNGSDWLNATKLAAAALKAWDATPPAHPE